MNVKRNHLHSLCSIEGKTSFALLLNGNNDVSHAIEVDKLETGVSFAEVLLIGHILRRAVEQNSIPDVFDYFNEAIFRNVTQINDLPVDHHNPDIILYELDAAFLHYLQHLNFLAHQLVAAKHQEIILKLLRVDTSKHLVLLIPHFLFPLAVELKILFDLLDALVDSLGIH